MAEASTKSQEAVATVSVSDLAALISAVKEQAPVKKVLFHERKRQTPFNPKGIKNRKMKRGVYVNNYRVNINMLFDEEIELYNKLSEGKYCSGLVTVRLTPQTGDTPDRLDILYANKTPEQRLNNAKEWRNNIEMLRRCVAEAS